MGDISLRDLHDMRTAITEDTRREVDRVERSVNQCITEVRAGQDRQDELLNAHGVEIGQLRTVIQERTAPLGVLTKRQKRWLQAGGVAVGAACLEGLRHIGGWLTNWATAHGVRLP